MTRADLPTPPPPTTTILYSGPVRGISLTNSKNASSTLTLVFAEVSIKGTPHLDASDFPSDAVTCLGNRK